MAKEPKAVREFRILVREEIKRLVEMKDKDPVMDECGEMRPNKRYGMGEADDEGEETLDEMDEEAEGDDDDALEEFPQMREADAIDGDGDGVANEAKAEALIMKFLKREGYKGKDISIDELMDSEEDALEYSEWNVSIASGHSSGHWDSVTIKVYDGQVEFSGGEIDDGGEGAYFNRWNQGDNIGYDEPQGYDDDYGYYEGVVRESDEHEQSVDLEDELDALEDETMGMPTTGERGSDGLPVPDLHAMEKTNKRAHQKGRKPGARRKPKREDYIDEYGDEDVSLSDLFDLEDEYGDFKNKYSRNPDPNEY